MKTKVFELEGDALDWAVANCEGYTDLRRGQKIGPYSKLLKQVKPYFTMSPPHGGSCTAFLSDLDYSTNPELAYLIIKRERISVNYGDSWVQSWRAFSNTHPIAPGSTPLIAAMRCYVASKLARTVAWNPDNLICCITPLLREWFFVSKNTHHCKPIPVEPEPVRCRRVFGEKS